MNAPTDPTAQIGLTTTGEACHEQILRFDEGGRLVGMLRAPVEPPAPEVPALILMNAGIIHRIGPRRLNVKLARALDPLPSLRVDLSGLGDSGTGTPGLDYQSQTFHDLKRSIEALFQALGERPVIVIGLCSGADNAYRLAVDEPRIAGMVALDPFSYPAPGPAFGERAKRVLDADRWRARLNRMAGGGVADPGAIPDYEALERGEQNISRPVPPLSEFGTDLAALTGRGAELFLLYTNYVKHDLATAEHFHSVFRDFEFHGRLRVAVHGDVDHTFTELAAQALLIGAIRDWLRERWGLDLPS
ncbi:MAG: hypothetical protein AAFV96_03875 [Pseudomonadota bacterium]